MTTFRLRDEGSETTVEAANLGEAVKLAKKWAREGDWDTSGGTVYVDVYIYEGDAEDPSEEVTEAIHQPAPKCPAGKHDWQSPLRLVGGVKENPGVFGNGGGVIINEACVLCGCGRRTNTWAQRRDTGEQGLTEVTYEPGRYSVESAQDEAGE